MDNRRHPDNQGGNGNMAMERHRYRKEVGSNHRRDTDQLDRLGRILLLGYGLFAANAEMKDNTITEIRFAGGLCHPLRFRKSVGLSPNCSL